VTAAQDGKLLVYDAYTGCKTHRVDLENRWVMSAAYSPQPGIVASGGLDNAVSLYLLNDDNGTGALKRQMNGHDGYVSCIKFIDATKLVSASGDETVAYWDVDRGTVITQFAGHRGNVNFVAVSPDGKLAVSGACDKTAKVWDLRDGSKPVRTFLSHKSDVNGTCFFPGGNAFATASEDGSGRLFDLRVAQAINTFGEAPETDAIPATSVAFSASGRLVFLGYEDGQILVWDAFSARQVATLKGHAERASALGVSKDGIALASAGWDKKVNIWLTA